ncbi:copper chaperone PCu(A)C [Zavarzinia compransoris]|uniref:Copper chaperone PCu(A)C n=1 Tax=Zavarzinia compransoris TaxID=1264899 RepID=A0A317E628_9PROT|nr:copper chaperone PCu(A)C [Zavarzinia compransoris]PWR21784.1 hypothetical protein DKG75_07280 [Zavarzinia compransoris]TDP45417.1 hypothetical protein DES42_105121 [Zavarzinia compransoris]
MTRSLLRSALLAAALLAGAGLTLAPALTEAHGFKIASLDIGHPWSRATPAGAKVAGGYLKVTNGGAEADRLLSVASAIADKVEIHEMAMAADGTASMHRLDNGVEIPAGATVELKPGSYHIMFIGLKRPLTEGEKFDGTLTFEKAGTVAVQFAVEAMGKTGGDHGAHQGH